MGWKSVKEHYRIEHAVHVTQKGICIGSAYIPDIIVICMDGKLETAYRDPHGANKDLLRYQEEFDADPAKLKELVLAKDTFSRSIPVYTYSGAEIIEKQCEELGWPNVTHDGYLMYDNRFSSDKDEVARWALVNANARVENLRESLLERKKEVNEIEKLLRQAKATRQKLKRLSPAEHNSATADVQTSKETMQ